MGCEPPVSILYNYSQNKLYIIKKYLEEYLFKDWIHISRLSAAVLVLLVRKLDRDIQFYINYCRLNKITIKNCYLFLFIKETLDWLSQAKFYIKLNLISAFNKIRIKEEKE